MFKKILSRFFGKKSDAKKTEEKKQNVIKPMMQPTVEEVKKTAPIVIVKAEQEKSEAVGIKEEETVLQSENHQADFCAAVEKEPPEDISDKLYKRRYAPKKKEDEQEKAEADNIISAETPSVTVMKDEDNETPFDTSREVSSVTESKNKSDEIYEMAEANKAEDDDMPFTVKKKENTEITEIFDDDIVIESVEQSEQLPLTVNEKNQNDVEKISADTPVNELKHLSVRAKESLLKSGMTVIGQITELSDEELRKLKAGYEIVAFRNEYMISDNSEVKETEDSVSGSKEETENTCDITSKVYYNDTSVTELDLSTSVINTLMRAGVDTIEKLMNISKEELLSIQNLGKIKCDEIIEFRNKISDNISERPKVEGNDVSDESHGVIYSDDTPIDELGLSVRTRNGLKRTGIMTLGMIIQTPEEELWNIRNLGEKSVREILEFRKGIDSMFSEVTPEISVRKEIVKVIKKLLCENEMFGIKLSDIYNVVSSDNEDIIYEILNEIAFKEHEKRFVLRSTPVIEILEKDDKTSDTHIEMLKLRMHGATLEEIALKYEITKERVRQIIVKTIKRVQKFKDMDGVIVSEERFKPLFEMYNFDEELFCTLTGQSHEVYMYLKATAKSGNLSVEELFSDMKVPKWFRNNWEEYCRKSVNSKYIFVTDDNNCRIEKSRGSIKKYVISKYCRNDIYFDDFISLYQNFLEKFGLADDERLRITESEMRSQENQIRDSEYVLWKQGKKFRYYNIKAGDYTELFDELNLGQYKDIEISTLKFFRDNPKLMKQYDIRDEYELHNLLRKIDCERINSHIEFGKTPYISFGYFDRKELIKEYMCKLAPISKENLAKAISEDYGYKEETILGQLSHIDDYYHDGMYSVDFDRMPDEMFSAFYECHNLKKVTIPDSVTSIEDFAFSE